MPFRSALLKLEREGLPVRPSARQGSQSIFAILGQVSELAMHATDRGAGERTDCLEKRPRRESSEGRRRHRVEGKKCDLRVSGAMAPLMAVEVVERF